MKIFLSLYGFLCLIFLADQTSAQGYPYNYTSGCRLSNGQVWAISQRTNRCVYWVTNCDVDNEYYVITPGGSGAACTTCGGSKGTIVRFAVYLCPIDDYVWGLILPLCGFGIYKMRKGKVKNIMAGFPCSL